MQGNAIAYNASLSSLETLRGKDGRSVTDPFGGFKGGLGGERIAVHEVFTALRGRSCPPRLNRECVSSTTRGIQVGGVGSSNLCCREPVCLGLSVCLSRSDRTHTDEHAHDVNSAIAPELHRLHRIYLSEAIRTHLISICCSCSTKNFKKTNVSSF